MKDLNSVFGIAEPNIQSKVAVHVVDYENLQGTIGSACSDSDIGFCCLGTTHGDAGSAAGFRRVDLDYVAAAGKVSKDAGINHFALVTAAGVYRWVPRLMSNYIWTKARAEEAILGLNFPRGTSIWHPGFLERGEFTRSGEKWAKRVGARGLPVAVLACAMRAYAEQITTGKRETSAEDVIENKGIYEMAKQG